MGLSVLALAVVLGGAPLPENDPLAALVEVKGMEHWKKLLTEVEPQQRWKQIHWTSAAAGLEAARAQRRPMLIAFKTGAGGKAHAPST